MVPPRSGCRLPRQCLRPKDNNDICRRGSSSTFLSAWRSTTTSTSRTSCNSPGPDVSSAGRSGFVDTDTKQTRNGAGRTINVLFSVLPPNGRQGCAFVVDKATYGRDSHLRCSWVGHANRRMDASEWMPQTCNYEDLG